MVHLEYNALFCSLDGKRCFRMFYILESVKVFRRKYHSFQERNRR